MSETHKRERFQFSLKTLLILIMLIAVGAGIHVVGYQRGYNAPKGESQADYIIWKKPK